VGAAQRSVHLGRQLGGGGAPAGKGWERVRAGSGRSCGQPACPRARQPGLPGRRQPTAGMPPTAEPPTRLAQPQPILAALPAAHT
jgi:hypothetical protein